MTGAPTPPRPDPFYRAVRAVARFWIWFFMKRVEVRHRGRVPERGPVLLCVNHPNNLIDSLLLGVTVPRKVHYVATAALFRKPLLARFLRAVGVIPIYRRQDDPDRMAKNTQAFAACWAALAEGRVIAIYPEGTTHAEARVQRIKTGAARIGLGYEARRAAGAPELVVVPVGLTFEARRSFRGRVLISFGPAIPLAPHVEQARDDPAKAVDALTTQIQWGMESQVIHADRIDAAEIARAVEKLYRDELVRQLQEARGLAAGQIDSLRLTRVVEEAVAHFRTRDPERVRRLWHRIQAYRALLVEYRVEDRAVRARAHPLPARRRIRTSGQAVLGLPLFVYGALVNAVPYLLSWWIAHRVARKETDYATVRMLASIVAFTLFWGLETWIVWRLGGLWWAAAFFPSLPVSGLVAYHYVAGLERLRGELRLVGFTLLHRHAASRLLAERAAILAELEQAKGDYLDTTRETLA